MNIQQHLHFLFETGGRHPMTTDQGITLAYYPHDNMIAAGRPSDYPTPSEVAQIAQNIATFLNLSAIATATRIGRSNFTLTKTSNGHQWHEPNFRIIEFYWTTQKTSEQVTS